MVDRRTVLTALLTATASSTLPRSVSANGAPQEAAAWPMLAGGPRRTGANGTVSGPEPPFRRRWSVEADDPSTAAVADGTVFFTTGESLRAVDLADGSDVWEFAASSRPTSPPVVVGGTVYAAFSEFVVGVETGTGEAVWAETLESAPERLVADEEGVFVVGSERARKLDPGTGAVQWGFDGFDQGSVQSPALGDDLLVVTQSGDTGGVWALDRGDGTVRWDHAIETSSYVSLERPIVGEDAVYVSDFNQRTYAMSRESGAIRWETATDGNRLAGAFSLHDGRLYVGSGRQHVLDTGSGERLDVMPDVSGASSPAPSIAGNLAYYPSSWDDSLTAVRVSDGERIGSFYSIDDLHETAAAVTDGVVVLSTGNSVVAVAGDANTSPPEVSVALSEDTIDEIDWEDDDQVNISITEGTTVTFDASDTESPDGSVASHNWILPDGSVETGAELSHTFTDLPEEMHVVETMRYVAVDENGVTAGLSVTVERYFGDTVIANIAPDYDTVEQGQDLTLGATNSNGEITSYEWTFGDGTSATGSRVSHTYDEPGEYVIELTVSGPDGQDSETLEVTVEAVEGTVGTGTASGTGTTAGTASGTGTAAGTGPGDGTADGADATVDTAADQEAGTGPDPTGSPSDGGTFPTGAFDSGMLLALGGGGAATLLGSYAVAKRRGGDGPAGTDANSGGSPASGSSSPSGSTGSDPSGGPSPGGSDGSDPSGGSSSDASGATVDDRIRKLDRGIDEIGRLREDHEYERALEGCGAALEFAERTRERATDRTDEVEDRVHEVERLRAAIESERETYERVHGRLDEAADGLETVADAISAGEYDAARRDLADADATLTAVGEASAGTDFADADRRVEELSSRIDRLRSRLESSSPSEEIPARIPGAPRHSLEYDDVSIEEPIGSGGNADVSRGTVELGGGKRLTLAVKEPRMSGTLQTDTVERVLEEAETWQQLDDHDHVVSVVDYGADPLPWIAMEYMDAGHLGDRAGDLPLEQALWMAVATTRAVRHAHRNGVAHLDLKPENILFRSVEGAWDVPKVGDWGLSKHLLDHSKSVEGLTPHYAAPEQFDDEYGAADNVTDVYQLGAVFYELFTGRPPFEGQPSRVMHNVLNDRPTPPSEVAEVPRALDEILLTALATEKADRYESVLYLRDELRDL